MSTTDRTTPTTTPPCARCGHPEETAVSRSSDAENALWRARQAAAAAAAAAAAEAARLADRAAEAASRAGRDWDRPL